MAKDKKIGRKTSTVKQSSETLSVRGAHQFPLTCRVCKTEILQGQSYFYAGSRSAYSRHCDCARVVPREIKQIEEGGKAGKAANGRIVRGTKSL